MLITIGKLKITCGLSIPLFNLQSLVINIPTTLWILQHKSLCYSNRTLFSVPQIKQKKWYNYARLFLELCSYLYFLFFSLIPGLKRFLIGLIYVSCYGALGSIFKSKYLISDEYAVSVHRVRCGNATYLLYVQNLPSVYQLLYLIIWGRIYLWMYVSIWILVVSKILFFLCISFVLFVKGGSLHLYRN